MTAPELQRQQAIEGAHSDEVSVCDGAIAGA